MPLSSHRVPPFFEEFKSPATITMLMGQMELALSGPNTLLLCSQELPTTLPVSAPPPAGTIANIKKRGRSLSTVPKPVSDDKVGEASTPPSTPPSRGTSIQPGLPATTRITRAHSRAHLSNTNRSCSVPEPPKKRRRVQLHVPSLSPEPLNLSTLGLSSGTEAEAAQDFYESDDADDDEDDVLGLISKPAGEAGRPGRGGYNLKDALGWSTTDFNRLKAKVDCLISKHLDARKSFVKQKESGIAAVVEKAVESTPILMKYADHWPLTDHLKLHLKYLSSKDKGSRGIKSIRRQSK